MPESMPEHEPLPEWMADTCGNSACGQEFEVRPENSRINIYTDHPECANVFTHCPHCDNYFMRLFILEQDPNDFIELGFEPFVDTETPKHILNAYQIIVESMEPELPDEPELQEVVLDEWISPRVEKYIRDRAEYIAHLFSIGLFNVEGDIYL